ncbi:MAG: winged helix-turn-helix domain-containing protein, partial [Mycobacteriales bacterium]
IRARVDLKADRRDGVLRVLSSWREEPGEGVAEALAGELRRAAAWQGLDDVVVEDRGDLARALQGAI